MCPLGKKKKGTEEIGNQKYKEYIPEPLTRANTCSYCFRACLCIGRIQTRKGRFMGASYKATQVSVLPLSVCFLNSIPSHYSCLQNLCVSTLESSLLSLLSLSRAGTTHTTREVAAPVKHKEGAGPPLSTLTRCSSVTQPKGKSLFSLLSNQGLFTNTLHLRHAKSPKSLG